MPEVHELHSSRKSVNGQFRSPVRHVVPEEYSSQNPALSTMHGPLVPKSQRSAAHSLRVGEFVGVSVGESDGTSVGVKDGAADGMPVGTSEGTSVGVSDGTAVGMSVGVSVGLVVGANVVAVVVTVVVPLVVAVVLSHTAYPDGQTTVPCRKLAHRPAPLRQCPTEPGVQLVHSS